VVIPHSPPRYYGLSTVFPVNQGPAIDRDSFGHRYSFDHRTRTQLPLPTYHHPTILQYPVVLVNKGLDIVLPIASALHTRLHRQADRPVHSHVPVGTFPCQLPLPTYHHPTILQYPVVLVNKGLDIVLSIASSVW
jgi:hypothetical protein